MKIHFPHKPQKLFTIEEIAAQIQSGEYSAELLLMHLCHIWDNMIEKLPPIKFPEIPCVKQPMGPTSSIGRITKNKMKITLSEPQIQVILAALEAFQRFRINQPKTALETIFPKQCWDLGRDKMKELVAPIQKAFFPNYSPNGGPGICNQEIGKDPQIAYEISKQIEQFLALKKSGGWFGYTSDFDGGLLNPSGEPPPEIEGLKEMQYMDFSIPEDCQDTVRFLIENESFIKLWKIIDDAMPDLPRGEKMEVINKFVDDLGAMQRYYVRVHKPRKKLTNP